MWWSENNIYQVLVLCECCAVCVFSEIVTLHGASFLQYSCVATVPRVVSAWALCVLAISIYCMFTGLQCRAWWQPTEMTELENHVPLGLTIKPVGDRTAIASLSALPVSFGCWLFTSLGVYLSWAPWECCPDDFAMMYRLNLCFSFLVLSPTALCCQLYILLVFEHHLLCSYITNKMV